MAWCGEKGWTVKEGEERPTVEDPNALGDVHRDSPLPISNDASHTWRIPFANWIAAVAAVNSLDKSGDDWGALGSIGQ